MKGSEAMVEAFLSRGLNTSFGITGGYINPFFDTLLNYEDKFNHLFMRHEQGAAHAAAHSIEAGMMERTDA